MPAAIAVSRKPLKPKCNQDDSKNL